MSNSVFRGDWAEEGLEALLRDFGKYDSPLVLAPDVEILYAWYEYADYSGDAFVIFRQGGKLYEVNGSHCSCYGLEGQWRPEETSAAALLARPHICGYPYDSDYKEIESEQTREVKELVAAL